MPPNLFVNILLWMVPAFVVLYSFWVLCKKDGFDSEKSFDLLLVAAFAGLALSFLTRYFTYRQPHFMLTASDIVSVVLGLFLVSTIYAYRLGWSVYRVLDNLALSLTLSAGSFFVMHGLLGGLKPLYLLVSLVLFLVYFITQKYRLVKIKSGFTFSLIGATFCIAYALALPKTNLIFVVFLFTLVLSVFIFRVRGLYVRHQKIRNTSGSS